MRHGRMTPAALLVAVALLTLIGCQTATPRAAYWGEATAGEDIPVRGRGGADKEATIGQLVATTPAAPTADEQAAARQQRVMIYTAALSIVVNDVDDGRAALTRIAQEAGGYLQQVSGNSVTIRVPADRFTAVLETVAGLGQVIDRALTAQDVTDEFVDLEARLANARRVRDRLLALLEQAKTVEETLAIEKELGRLNEEIERYEGRLKLLRDRVALSTITVTFERVAPLPQMPRDVRQLPFGWLRELDVRWLYAN
jgi:hypothetical protein